MIPLLLGRIGRAMTPFLIIEITIDWADALYKELCGNSGTAAALLEYKENQLRRAFYFIVNSKLLCIKEVIDDKVDETILPEEQLAEIIKNGFIVVKKY